MKIKTEEQKKADRERAKKFYSKNRERILAKRKKDNEMYTKEDLKSYYRSQYYKRNSVKLKQYQKTYQAKKRLAS